MSGSGLSNPAQHNLDVINSFSPDDQKLLFVSLMGNANYDSVDDWKAAMARDAANYKPDSGVATSTTLTLQQVAQRFGLTDAASADGDTVSLSPAAQLAVASGKTGAPVDTDSSKSALQTLTGGANAVTGAGVALTLLTSATSKDSDEKDGDTVVAAQKTYATTGKAVDLVA